MTQTRQRCSEQVWGEFHTYQCKRMATTEENGQPYCTQHTPSLREAKMEKSIADRTATWEAERGVKRMRQELRSRQADLFPELLAALKLAEPVLDAASATAHESGATMIGGARPAWESVKAVLAKAQGH